jgi:hypothetical protein
VGGSNIQKYEFIGTGLVVNLCQLYRITGISQIHKIDAFDHTPRFHV